MARPCAMVESAQAPSMLRAMTQVLWSPRTAFDAVIARGGGFNWLFALLALELLLERPETASILGMRLSEAPVAAVSNFIRYAVGPAVFVFIAGVALHYRTRDRTEGMDIERWAGLVTLAWVPHTVWIAISVLLARAGLDHSLLPHVSARSQLLEGGELWQFLGLAIELAPVLVFVVLAYRHVLGHAPDRVSPGRHRAPVLAASTLIVAGALAANAAHVRSEWDTIRPVGTGDHLPHAHLTGLNGPSLDTHTLHGKVVLVDFWATWCGPCRQTLPTLQTFHDELGSEDFVLLSVNVEPEDPQGVRDFMAEQGLRFPVHLDDGTLQSRLHVDTLPTAFLVDRQGVVRDMHVGAWGVSALRSKIERLIGESPPVSTR